MSAIKNVFGLCEKQEIVSQINLSLDNSFI